MQLKKKKIQSLQEELDFILQDLWIHHINICVWSLYAMMHVKYRDMVNEVTCRSSQHLSTLQTIRNTGHFSLTRILGHLLFDKKTLIYIYEPC